MPIPLMILGDSFDLRSGLGRIARDIAICASRLPEFRVASLGRGGHGTRKVAVTQYCFPEERGWGCKDLQHAWEDFVGYGQPGILLAVWDATRLHWLSRPNSEMGPLYGWLREQQMTLWTYGAVDATGPADKLSSLATDALTGFHRVLAYTEFGAGVISRSLGREVDWLPHGFNGDVFQPRDRKAARMAMGVRDDHVLIGTVATNQPRKDWGCAAATIRELRKGIRNLTWWVHTDVLERSHAWSIRALLADFGLEDCTRVTMTGAMTDRELSYYYSACDVTMLPSSEGFGYPIVESLACGVPCVHSTYGGGAELVPPEWRVQPEAFRLEGIHDCVRPVFNPGAFAEAVRRALDDKRDTSALVEHLNWPMLHWQWKKWLREGIQ